MEKKYIVRLTPEQRKDLLSIVKKGKAAAKKIMHAKILLEADISEGRVKSDKEIAESLYIDLTTVTRVRKRLVEEGLESALHRKEHSATRPRRFDGEKEAKLVAICCSQAPEGRQSWTLQLLADQVVRMNIVEEVSASTVGRALKKTNLSLGKKRMVYSVRNRW